MSDDRAAWEEQRLPGVAADRAAADRLVTAYELRRHLADTHDIHMYGADYRSLVEVHDAEHDEIEDHDHDHDQETPMSDVPEVPEPAEPDDTQPEAAEPDETQPGEPDAGDEDSEPGQ